MLPRRSLNEGSFLCGFFMPGSDPNRIGHFLLIKIGGMYYARKKFNNGGEGAQGKGRIFERMEAQESGEMAEGHGYLLGAKV